MIIKSREGHYKLKFSLKFAGNYLTIIGRSLPVHTHTPHIHIPHTQHKKPMPQDCSADFSKIYLELCATSKRTTKV